MEVLVEEHLIRQDTMTKEAFWNASEALVEAGYSVGLYGGWGLYGIPVYKGEKKIMDFNTSYVRGKGVEFCVERGAGAMRGSYITKVKSLVKKAKELEAYKNKKDLDSKIYAFSCNLAEKVMMPVVARLCDRLNAAKIANGRLAQSTYSSTDYEYISIEENGAKFLTLHMNKHTPLRMGVESSTPAKIMEIAAAVKMYEADLLAARKTIISQVAEYRKGLETAV